MTPRDEPTLRLSVPSPAMPKGRQRVKFFAVAKDGARKEITDLYWFEENGVHSLDDESPSGERVEVVIEMPVTGAMNA